MRATAKDLVIITFVTLAMIAWVLYLLVTVGDAATNTQITGNIARQTIPLFLLLTGAGRSL